jgi:hypothetical protein
LSPRLQRGGGGDYCVRAEKTTIRSPTPLTDCGPIGKFDIFTTINK